MAQAGYSQKLRYVNRTQKINIESIKEVLDRDNVTIRYINTSLQVAGIFTKPVTPETWEYTMHIMNIITGSQRLEKIAWPGQVIFNFPLLLLLTKANENDCPSNKRSRMPRGRPPEGPKATEDIVNDIFNYFSPAGIDPEVVQLLVQLSDSTTPKGF